MKFQFTPKGTCSRSISFDITNGRVSNISFVGGCNGNLKGICALANDMPADKIIKTLRGIDCNGKGTSCPDQLARAIEAALPVAEASC